eukprot:s367_g4.t1
MRLLPLTAPLILAEGPDHLSGELEAFFSDKALLQSFDSKWSFVPGGQPLKPLRSTQAGKGAQQIDLRGLAPDTNGTARLAKNVEAASAGPKTVRQGPHVAVTSRVVLQPNPNFDITPPVAKAPVSSPIKSPVSKADAPTTRVMPYTLPPPHSAEAQQVQLLGEFTKTLQSILTKLQNPELDDSQREKYQAMADKIHSKIKTIKLAGSAPARRRDSWLNLASQSTVLETLPTVCLSVCLIAEMQVHTFARFSNLVRGSQDQEPSSKRSLLQGTMLRISDKVSSFFFGSAADSVHDNLVEVVRRNPVAATSLLRTVSWFSGGSYCSLSCKFFNCLFAWCSFWFESGADLQERIVSLTSSQAWQMSKKVAVFQYGWFVLGMVWWVHTDECPECPSISKLMAAVMALSVGRAGLAVCTFRAFFGHEESPDKAPAATGATHSQISALPAYHFKMCSCSKGEDSQEPCSICLSGFGEGVLMRRLPCGHHFHRQCIYKWLRRNKRCPLCMRAIDESPTSKPNHCEASK